MNNKSSYISFFSFLIFGTNLLFGQTSYCGTHVSKSQKGLEATYTSVQALSTQSVPQINRTISISVFVVKEKDTKPFDEATLPVIITSLNQFFTPIALNFSFCSIQHIDNFQFDVLDANTNAKDLRIQYSESNTINLYLVSSITDVSGLSVSGFTFMPGDTGKNCIFMTKSEISGSSLAHQLGHFFNLYHTYETTYGNEIPDEITCSTTGDRCCDTNASPDLNIQGMVKNCIYIGNEKISNQFYNPSTKNMMSLVGNGCNCDFFSKTQFLRMVYALNNFRNDLR